MPKRPSKHLRPPRPLSSSHAAAQTKRDGRWMVQTMPGQAAVVSTFRLKKKARDAAHVQRRLNNTALHEVGHTFGLDHCTEALCPMQDAEGSIANTDAANDVFGPECAAELEAGFPLRRFP